METRTVKKPWGFELIYAITEKYVGKVLHVNKGESLSLQFHNIKDETASNKAFLLQSIGYLIARSVWLYEELHLASVGIDRTEIVGVEYYRREKHDKKRT